jgi:ribosomal protein S18 acetylase RimI-like enzyme
MAPNKIQVTPFTDTDIKSIIPVHFKAFKGYINASMGERYVEAFFTWFLTCPKTVTLKATSERNICGYVVGAPLGYDKQINIKLLKFAITGTLTHPLVLLHKDFLKIAFRKLMLIFTKSQNNKIVNPEGHGISLVGIGIDSNYTGLGIGQQLMKAFEVRATELGMNFMRLSVYNKNFQAIHIYEKCGWKKLGKQGNVFYFYKELS